MKKQTRNQKGFAPLLIVVLVIVVAIAVVYFITQQTTENVPAIKSSGDLTTVSSDLDNIDMGQFNKELNLLNADTSTF